MAAEGTEPASERKLREARLRGEVPRSGALAPSVLFLSLLAVLFARGETAYAEVARWLHDRLAASDAASVPEEVGAALWGSLGWLAGWLLLAWALVWGVDRLQIGAVWARGSRPGPVPATLQGWLSAILLAAVSAAALAWSLPATLDAVWVDPPGAGGLLATPLSRFAWTFALGASLVAAIDVARSRAHHFASLRMTRREQQQELRDAQGPSAPRREQRRRLGSATGRR